jgi:hypothetical protein
MKIPVMISVIFIISETYAGEIQETPLNRLLTQEPLPNEGLSWTYDNMEGSEYSDSCAVQYTIESPNHRWIAGLVDGVHEDPTSTAPLPDYYWHRIQLWDVETGQTIMQGVSPYADLSMGVNVKTNYYFQPAKRIYTSVKKAFFSSDNRFCMMECLNDPNHTGKYSPTVIHLIDVENRRFLPANRDVAFSSDCRYYVTERRGKPSLIDANTHKTVARYETGSTMSSCCFSPEDRKVYIACEDLQIYEFDSHIPETAIVDWELYEGFFVK